MEGDDIRRERAKWARDLVFSCILVPAILAYFDMTPLAMIAGSAASLVILAAIENWSWLNAKGLQLGPAILIMISLTGLTVGGVWAVASWKPTQAETQRLSAPQTVKLHSLEELYESDFVGLNIARNETLLTIGTPPPLHQIHAAYIMDLNVGASFALFYIPADIDADRGANYLLDNVESFVEDRAKNTTLTGQITGESQPVKVPKFIRRIYIYHAGPLAPEAVGLLTKSFSKRDLDVIFRSNDYAVGRFATETLLSKGMKHQ